MPCPPSEPISGEQRPGRDFPDTRWSLVIAAGNETVSTRRALEELCRLYWYPTYCFLRRTNPEADAKDLAQGFFEGLLRRDDFGKLTETRGRFRTFLIGALKNFLANEYHRKNRLKRGGGEFQLSIDELLAEKKFSMEPMHTSTPEKIYEFQYARTLLDLAISRLREEFLRKKRGGIVDDLLPFLVPHARESSYQKLCEKLGISNGAARKAVLKMRKELRITFIAEVKDTLKNPDDQAELDEEIQHLMQVIGIEHW